MRSTDMEKLEEMSLAIELWKDSGLSQRAYCEQEGYTISKFKYWIKKLKNPNLTSGLEKSASPKKKPPVFISVEVSNKEQKLSEEISTLEIHYPSGVKIICRENLESFKLQTLIRAI